MLWVLDHQYVSSARLPNRVWKVVLGSGMGLRHSGSIAEAALYDITEKWFVDDAGGFAPLS